MFHLIKDTRGKPSWTMTLSVPILILLTIRYLISGFDITIDQFHFTLSIWSGSDYALASGIWLGFIAQREYVEKIKISE